jgi:putative membrane protein
MFRGAAGFLARVEDHIATSGLEGAGPAEDGRGAVVREAVTVEVVAVLAAVALPGAGNMSIHMSRADRERVISAIREAESRTSGEIVVVITTQSDDYIHVPLHVAAGIALIIPLILPALAPIFPWATISLPWVFLLQLACFIVLALILSIPTVRYTLTPKALMHKYAHRHAAAQFLGIQVHATEGRTGVLIFVSLVERYCEIVADLAISSKVDNSHWQFVVSEMLPLLRRRQQAEALILGVKRCGDFLAKHFPPGTPNPNELPDHLIIIDTQGV